jgi:hypothetical protein
VKRQPQPTSCVIAVPQNNNRGAMRGVSLTR